MSYSVIVCDLFHRMTPDHEFEVSGFPSKELAIEYARRRTQSALEALRQEGLTEEALLALWKQYGEDCRVVGPEGVVYLASSELQQWLSHPASPEACDYQQLYYALLPEDFYVSLYWAEGAVPPPDHYEFHIEFNHAGEGSITFWPDYPAQHVPGWQKNFFVPFTDRVRIYQQIQESQLFHDWKIQENGPIGGASVWLRMTADKQTFEVRSNGLPPEKTIHLQTILVAIRAIVPASVWDDLETQRWEYIQKRVE